MTFEVLRKNLRDIYLCASSKATRNLSDGDQQSQDAPQSTTCGALLPHVDIVHLFTDVAGLTREQSQFGIYPNYCYTMKAHTKKLVIDILPPRQATSKEIAVEKQDSSPISNNKWKQTQKQVNCTISVINQVLIII